jgi:hypothetical protein
MFNSMLNFNSPGKLPTVTFLLLLITSCIAGDTCYYLDGSIATDAYRCNNATTGESTCCGAGTNCWSNGVFPCSFVSNSFAIFLLGTLAHAVILQAYVKSLKMLVSSTCELDAPIQLGPHQLA